MKLSILMLGLFSIATAHADIYKQVDASGQVTYTDRPIKGAKRLVLEPAATALPRTTNNNHAATKKASLSPSPADFPRVDTDVQRKRDNVRRNVLEDELRAEEQALSEAVMAKKESEVPMSGEKTSSPSYIIRSDKLSNNIKLHRDNINALRKELSTVK